jgi:hypothetical protein
MCVCVLGGRNPSLMMETADITLRMLSITGVTRDVADVKSSRDCGFESHPRGAWMFLGVLFSWSGEGSQRVLKGFYKFYKDLETPKLKRLDPYWCV